MKTFGKITGGILGLVLVLVLGLVSFLSITEFKPEPEMPADGQTDQNPQALSTQDALDVLCWNIGYAGLDREEDFFMDGGDMVFPKNKEIVYDNMEAIAEALFVQDADLYLLQEVDRDSTRSNREDQLLYFSEILDLGYAYGTNFRCPFIPYPLPPLGRMEAGIATLSAFPEQGTATRVALPCPFSWPVRTANMKRCLLVNRFPLSDSDRELVVVNLHLEAYDDGAGRAAQTQMLLEVLNEEYAKGNYVLAGGDFNQCFPGTVEAYPILESENWAPGLLEPNILPEGWTMAYDLETPSCRLLHRPYTGPETAQYYVLDGFLVSPNLEVVSVQNVDLDFQHSDHNPVHLELRFLP